MNLDALEASVSAKGFSFLNTDTDPANPILIALNSVYRQINGAQRWPWLEATGVLPNTVAGTQSYSLSSISDLRQLDAVRMTDSFGNHYDLQNVEPQTFKQNTWESTGSLTQTATPQFWTQYAGQVLLYPVPDAVYTLNVDYIHNPADLAAANDVPVLPPIYHDVLVWGAVLELAFRERNIWAQELAQGYYQTRYKQMQQEFELMQRQTSSTVKKSGFNDSYGYDFGWSAGT